jgi:hypothetical protein
MVTLVAEAVSAYFLSAIGTTWIAWGPKVSADGGKCPLGVVASEWPPFFCG